uniref:Ubiquitin-like protease family profile domain-containing protein n=1 Tax=Chromera velia CCMP2878 TaxID=1169474 RepID=A0A0G4HT24_9ALVE|eukprot:Cvel_8389.t1-p1 / transcript=Cvel_8389.t1 / gene=Cvel_8389 / organism=Chromera_velia_CCMP2878 / gene_product=hypothetical protein / transcript_product=hypothetical protein / location=Cvel_scaffold463:1389-9115(+) / protein_length=591 / sequence_SO=supercontig / SO=protein_coding / is_pseudo=false
MSNKLLHVCKTWKEDFPAESLDRLQQGKWLDNRCVNFYLAAFVDSVVDKSPELKRLVHIENSSFHSAFVDTTGTVDYEHIEGRISKEKGRMNKVSFLSVFPIFKPENHWFVSVLLSPESGLSVQHEDDIDGAWTLIIIDPLYNFLSYWKQHHVILLQAQDLQSRTGMGGPVWTQRWMGGGDPAPPEASEAAENEPSTKYPSPEFVRRDSEREGGKGGDSGEGRREAVPLLSLIQTRRPKEQEEEEGAKIEEEEAKENAEKFNPSGDDDEEESEVPTPFQPLTMCAIRFHRTVYKEMVTQWRDNKQARPELDWASDSEKKKRQAQLSDLVLKSNIPGPTVTLVQQLFAPVSSALDRFFPSSASQSFGSSSSATSGQHASGSRSQAEAQAAASAAAATGSDNPKLPTEFRDWIEISDSDKELTGLLYFTAGLCLHYLEGNTETLFRALHFFGDLQKMVEKKHGTRAMPYWDAFVNPATKGAAIPSADDGTLEPGEKLFEVYGGLLKVMARLRDEEAPGASHYLKAHLEDLPTLDQLAWIQTHAGPHVFTYSEFKTTFIDHSKLVIDSERLWPPPPSIDYYSPEALRSAAAVLN